MERCFLCQDKREVVKTAGGFVICDFCWQLIERRRELQKRIEEIDRMLNRRGNWGERIVKERIVKEVSKK